VAIGRLQYLASCLDVKQLQTWQPGCGRGESEEQLQQSLFAGCGCDDLVTCTESLRSLLRARVEQRPERREGLAGWHQSWLELRDHHAHAHAKTSSCALDRANQPVSGVAEAGAMGTADSIAAWRVAPPRETSDVKLVWLSS
jgi:hypothetical protein